MRKKRVLIVGESSFLSTGFSTYSLELLKRLHATGKYELFELGSYGPPGDPRSQDLPWGYMTAMPEPGNEKQEQLYHSNPLNQFGEWKFEEACVAFRPDFVLSHRDWWSDEFIERSPFRRFYRWMHMATVDSMPQHPAWISTFLNADAVFTYSDWALEALREQGRGYIKLRCSAPPGADLDTLRPSTDRKEHRRRMGVDPECFIVGTVMRNQKRKLYPDLIQAFAQFLRQAPADLAKKTFLYMHTSWPDVGWDIPRLIHEEGVGHKCVFTYHCGDCGTAFPSFFADAKTTCRRCGSSSARFPNSHFGVSRAVLGDVLNLFDCYVQYSNSEGSGMPQMEAAACGVPVFAVDYSAMSDVVRKLKGWPIKVQRLFRESETHCWRALPDNADFVQQLQDFLSLPEPVRAKRGYEARKAVETHYTYDRTAKIWEDAIDGFDVDDRWALPAQVHEPVLNVPANLSNEELVRWGILHVAGRPDLLNSYMALRMVRDLNWEASLPHMGGIYFNEASTLGTQTRYAPFNREIALQELLKICEKHNFWEGRRTAR